MGDVIRGLCAYTFSLFGVGFMGFVIKPDWSMYVGQNCRVNVIVLGREDFLSVVVSENLFYQTSVKNPNNLSKEQ